MLKSGTIVDATIIAAPPSTKNAEGERDPEMHQTKKGKDWHFGMKVHVGTDRRGMVHTLVTTAGATRPTSRGCRELLHGEETRLVRGSGVLERVPPRRARSAGIRYRVNRRAKPGRALSERERSINRTRSRPAGPR